MILETSSVLIGLALILYAVDYLFSLRDDPNEPRRIRSRVPLIGHMLGMLQAGPSYYSIVSKNTNEEIFSLPMLDTKIYVTASSRLLPLVQKQSRSLSFRPFLQIVSKKYGDATDETFEIFGGTMPEDLSHSVHKNLSPGATLDELNLRMGERVLIEMSLLLNPNDGKQRQARLLDWSRHLVVQATSCAMYGRVHPFLDAEVEKAFWKWQNYLTAHLSGWMDFTGAGYAARQKVFDAYIKWWKNVPADASQLARDYKKLLGEAGINELDNAKQASIFTIASFSNSAPTLYWTIYELFSRPELLQDIRDEITSNAISTPEPDQFSLDVAALKTKCPLLLSHFQETQRFRHVNPSFRKVMADTWLDGKYLLKAGHYLQIPGRSIHYSNDFWGEEATKFDAHRFIRQAGGKNTFTSNGFVPWGAAPFLCPARQFAATEIMVVVAMLAMRADIQPKKGIWDRSPPLRYEDLSTLSNPKKDVEMSITLRDEWLGDWKLHFGDSKSRVSLASG